MGLKIPEGRCDSYMTHWSIMDIHQLASIKTQSGGALSVALPPGDKQHYLS